MPLIIFAIDNGQEPSVRRQFLYHLQNLIRCRKVPDSIRPHSLGYWEGQLEFSYVLPEDVFWKYVHRLGYTANQQCFARVEELRPGEPLHLVDGDRRVLSFVGQLMASAREPRDVAGWTFNDGLYWYTA